MGLAPEKVTTVIDGVHLGFFSEKFPGDLKKDLGIPEDAPVVLYTGALLKSKGIDNLFQAIPQVLAQVPQAVFLIVGYPVEESQALVQALGVAGQCLFVGQVDFFKLPAYLQISNLAVDPKLDEAGEASGKIINYMGAGLPIVCFEGINNRKFLAENGVYAQSGDVEDLARKMVEIIKSPERARALGRANRQRVEEVFSWDASILEYQRVFQTLAP
jgi:glycosyltransferase involved in cell wall biosynthesis